MACTFNAIFEKDGKYYIGYRRRCRGQTDREKHSMSARKALKKPLS